MLTNQLRTLQVMGPRNAIKNVWQHITRQQAKSFRELKYLFTGRRGLEIGGPSTLFQAGHALPIYPVFGELDNCLFSTSTVWLSNTQQGRHFRYDGGRRLGYQYICDGTDLRNIPVGRYDCVLSCNTLEHIANPLKALKKWTRVLTDSGTMLVVVPAKDHTFDHKRPVTTLAHLLDDWEQDVSEDSLSHLDEILALHDLSRDPAAGGSEAFRNRCERNSEYRCLHHHVFNTELLVSALDFVGLQVCVVDTVLPHNLVAIARRTRPNEPRNNDPFLDGAAEYRRCSPFHSDRIQAPHRGNREAFRERP